MNSEYNFICRPCIVVTAGEMLVCLTERMWTCNGLGSCYDEDRPDTLVGWKIDVEGKRYALCSRAGKGCAEWQALQIGDRHTKKDFQILADLGGHPETFKLDPETNKLAAVRISGGFIGILESGKSKIDTANIQIQSRVGTCIPVAQ
ncbi:MAG: hypothetical protein HYX63_10185 [Gammaproteobacteria bacterium]|nr:hypothetical protein [Gammaproteobacteria bacterium]